MEDAIDSALISGRNGLGSVVVFASGNFSPDIDYPAYYNPDILCVGSITAAGSRASSSGYGSALDVIAPGDSILSTLPNNITGILSGTSMAAPHVSGIAALVLSVNPNLTQDEVRDAIEFTCTKIGSYNYAITSGRTNGTWHQQMGYGLVNAHAAVLSVIQNISGSSILCSSGSTYTINDVPLNSTITWTHSSNISRVSSQGSNPCTFKSISNGEGWIEAAISNNCGVITLPRKEIWTGKPGVPTTSPSGYPTIQLNSGELLSVSLLETPGASSSSGYWTCNGSLSRIGTATGSNTMFEATGTGIGNFYVTTTNSCDTSNVGGGTVNVSGGGPGPGPLMVYPNPATESFEVQLDDTVVSDDQAGMESELLLYDQFNNLKEIHKFKGKKHKIYTNRLTKGIYIVEVINKNGRYSTKVIIE